MPYVEAYPSVRVRWTGRVRNRPWVAWQGRNHSILFQQVFPGAESSYNNSPELQRLLSIEKQHGQLLVNATQKVNFRCCKSEEVEICKCQKKRVWIFLKLSCFATVLRLGLKDKKTVLNKNTRSMSNTKLQVSVNESVCRCLFARDLSRVYPALVYSETRLAWAPCDPSTGWGEWKMDGCFKQVIPIDLTSVSLDAHTKPQQ